jgi:signal transduction histidine kinase
VEQVVEDLEARLQEKQGTVHVQNLPVIFAHRTQMRQVFLNLISNALKFSKKDVPPKIIVHAGAVVDDKVEIRVQDNGIGFEAKYAQSIFEPFRRLHSRAEYEGTGFGLATCKRIVESHGGTIRAESHPGEGATFVLTFPVFHP